MVQIRPGGLPSASRISERRLGRLDGRRAGGQTREAQADRPRTLSGPAGPRLSPVQLPGQPVRAPEKQTCPDVPGQTVPAGGHPFPAVAAGRRGGRTGARLPPRLDLRRQLRTRGCPQTRVAATQGGDHAIHDRVPALLASPLHPETETGADAQGERQEARRAETERARAKARRGSRRGSLNSFEREILSSRGPRRSERLRGRSQVSLFYARPVSFWPAGFRWSSPGCGLHCSPRR